MQSDHLARPNRQLGRGYPGGLEFPGPARPPQRKAGGLSVNELDDLARSGRPVTLNRAGHDLALQRVKADGSASNLSSNAYDLVITLLKEANFKSVTIQVR